MNNVSGNSDLLAIVAGSLTRSSLRKSASAIKKDPQGNAQLRANLEQLLSDAQGLEKPPEGVSRSADYFFGNMAALDKMPTAPEKEEGEEVKAEVKAYEKTVKASEKTPELRDELNGKMEDRDGIGARISELESRLEGKELNLKQTRNTEKEIEKQEKKRKKVSQEIDTLQERIIELEAVAAKEGKTQQE